MNKVGDARVGLVGFPSVGKSTLLTKLTGTFSEAAGYEFTTLTCIPGIIRYRGARIQLLDLPGIIEGAKDGKGRGRQVRPAPHGAVALRSPRLRALPLLLPCPPGDCHRTHLQSYSNRAGLPQAVDAQEADRARA